MVKLRLLIAAAMLMAIVPGILAFAPHAQPRLLPSARGGSGPVRPFREQTRRRASASGGPPPRCRCLQMTGGGEAPGAPPPQPLVKLVTQLTGLFPFWVLGAGTLGFLKPAALGWLKGELVTFSLALTMLFMGMTLTVSDFDRVLKNPKQVFLGFLCQFTIMPLLGWTVARVFQLPVPLAVGTILVACCPGGTASNLVTLIAKADVALSVLMTTVSTCAAPLMTPLLTSLLAGSLVPVAAGGLVLSTLQVVIAPVVAGLLINTYLPKLSAQVSAFTPLLCVILVALICGSVIGQTAASLVAAGPSLLAAVVSLHLGGFVLGYTVPKLLGYPAPVSARHSLP
jgi:BASS family bile acid:Na+ symporter